ncbi:MAG: acetyltransferase [Chloroflexi bacterium]|nr:acetyltransferase [Chloroflexota bacterium]
MTRVLILGAGGHAQVVADILLHMHQASDDIVLVGYLDDNPQLLGMSYLGLPVLGKLDKLPTIDHETTIVGIGDNQTRLNVFVELCSRGEEFSVARHPTATIALGVSIGPGSMVCAGVIVNPGSVIGSNVILNTGCTVDHHNQIADHVHIAPGAHLGADVHIGTGALVGIGATVIPQRSVGDWSVIGAGSVVTKDIPDGVVAVGMPARVIRKLDQGNIIDN